MSIIIIFMVDTPTSLKFVLSHTYLCIFNISIYLPIKSLDLFCCYGEVGAGGIIFDPGGNLVMSYAWGIWHRIDNKAEWLTLLLGMYLARKKNISNLIVWWLKASHTENENLIQLCCIQIQKNLRSYMSPLHKSSSFLLPYSQR